MPVPGELPNKATSRHRVPYEDCMAQEAQTTRLWIIST
jgi:hypothetical protein